jgi:hypothetical protein
MQSRLRARPLLVSLGLVLGGASGCAAGGARFAAEPEPTTVEEAQAQLARARQELEGSPASAAAPPPASVSAPSGGAASPESPPAAPQAAPPSPSVTSTGQATESSAEGDRPVDARDACALPCHAIASMRRAVDAICRMAGAQDARCLDARKILKDDQARVAPCGC